MMGNSFTNRAKVIPCHNAFVQKILPSNCHIIATILSKQDYVFSEKNGKILPEMIGLKGLTREGLDYEFTIVLELDLKHQATATMKMTLRMVNQPASVPDIREQVKVLEAEVIKTTPLQPKVEKQKRFNEANTESVSLLHLKNDCIIPVFRDNEKAVSEGRNLNPAPSHHTNNNAVYDRKTDNTFLNSSRLSVQRAYW